MTAFRLALFSSVAAGSLMLAGPAALANSCLLDGTTVTCTGDVSSGVHLNDPAIDVNIYDVTTDITSTTLTGINIQTTDYIHANVQLGEHRIDVDWADLDGHVADGVAVRAEADDKSADLIFQGTINSVKGHGIIVEGWGGAAVTSTGDITSKLDAIVAHSATSGKATVESDGTLTSTKGYGVRADGVGSVVVDVSGSIHSYLDGIKATAAGEDADGTVRVIGDAGIESSTGYGIYADSSFHSVIVDYDGPVTGKLGGIYAWAHGDASDGTVSVTMDGDVSSSNGVGIWADSSFHAATVYSGGHVEAAKDGIYVRTHSDSDDASTKITQRGSVTSTAGNGVVAVSDFHSATIDNIGDINAYVDGLVALSHGSASDSTSAITSAGYISTQTGRGIYAMSDFNAASVDSTSTIEAESDGISVVTHGSDGTASSIVKQVGNITSYNGNGISATSDFSSATITFTGDLQAQQNGLYALAHGTEASASALVTNYGSVTTTAGYGIIAQADNRSAKVLNYGHIDAGSNGIMVITKGSSYDSSAIIENNADVTSRDGRALMASASNSGASIKSKGLISADGDAIVATSTGTDSNSTAIVDQNGNVTSTTGYGILATSANQAATVFMVGDVEAAKDAIRATSTGDGYAASVHVTMNGNLTSHNGYGLYATASDRNVTVANVGDIDAYLTGIYARSTGDNEDSTVLITQQGDITSTTELGIRAESTNRGVVITSTGDITGKTGGITAISTGNVASATIHVTNVGDIITTGSSGSGIYGYASNREVSISQNGDVSGGDYGLNAKSEGSSVDITLLGGTISNTDLAGVLMDSIGGNVFNNHGTVNNGDGVAILAKGWGGTIINNYGTINGDVTVQDVSGRLNNYGSGVYNIGTIDFQKGGTLYNYATLSPGGTDSVDVATVKGNLVNQGGAIVIDIEDATSDRLDVTGKATLDGTLKLNFISLSQFKDFTVLTSSGLTDQNLKLSTTLLTQDSTISYVDGTDVVLNLKLTYALSGVAAGNTELAQALENAYLDGGTGLGSVLGALANLETIDEYNAALDQLAGENYTQDTSSIRLANMAFTDRLFSCKVQDGAYMYSAEGECGWFSMAAGSFDRSSDIAGFDYSQNSQQIALGGQIALDADWRLGGAFGFTQFQGSNGLGATTDGAQYEAGGVLKYDNAGTVLSTAVSVGTMAADSVRRIDFGGLDQVLTGRANGAFASLRFQASHTFDYGDFYLKPMADLNLTQIHQDEFVEEGGDAALDIEAHDQLIATLDPSLEIGGQVKVSDSVVLRPYVRAGISVISGGDGETTASFVEGEGTTFTVSNSDDKLLGKVSAGADLLGLGEANFRLYYEGAFGETTKRQTVGLKISMPF